LAFYERLAPFATAFMALFERQALPHRSTLSRFLAALDQSSLEALRELFLEDLVTRTAQSFPPGGLWDRQEHHWLIIDVDGTKQAVRQRALPQTDELPAPQRRFEQACAPAYLGRKRGEGARTRTTVLQAHSHQWLGTFGGPGNGDYRGELTRASEAIISYASWLCMPLAHILIRLDGLYGNLAVLDRLLASGLGILVRCKDYGLLDLPIVQARLKQPADQHMTHPESGVSRMLFDCPDLALRSSRPRLRLIVATHPTTSTAKPPIGVLREKTVYELFLTTAPQAAFSCRDLLELYLHRGSFETVLSDEDREQDPDRWCSHTTCGQECWQIVQQWLWNLRLELGQHLSLTPMRLMEFAPGQEPPAVPSHLPTQEPPAETSHRPPLELPTDPLPQPVHYGPPQFARSSFTKGFAGSDFVLQPDGTLRCPAGHPLSVHERRPERYGSVRVVYGARIVHCRPCPLRAQCQESVTTHKPRQVSAVLWPIESSPPVPAQPSPPTGDAPIAGNNSPPLAPVLWGDWPRCQLRRRWMRLLHTQTVELSMHAPQPEAGLDTSREDVQTRAQRAHWRLSWQQRLARNARPSSAPFFTMIIYGLPAALAQYIGVGLVTAA
jgi:hypothetical protein